MKSRAQINTIRFHRRVFLILTAIVMVFLSLYVYFVSKSVINVVVREEIENDIIAVNSRLGDLELSYINLKNQITPEFAYSNGFFALSEKTYVERTGDTRLTLRSSEE